MALVSSSEINQINLQMKVKCSAVGSRDYVCWSIVALQCPGFGLHFHIEKLSDTGNFRYSSSADKQHYHIVKCWIEARVYTFSLSSSATATERWWPARHITPIQDKFWASMVLIASSMNSSNNGAWRTSCWIIGCVPRYMYCECIVIVIISHC